MSEHAELVAEVERRTRRPSLQGGSVNEANTVAIILVVLACFLVGWLFFVLSAHDASTSFDPEWFEVAPPRPGVACWRSGHAVVCLPEENP
jgi:hypothetical protein